MQSHKLSAAAAFSDCERCARACMPYMSAMPAFTAMETPSTA